MFLIYKIFLGFFGIYYLVFCGVVLHTSIIEDWCCDHVNFMNALSNKWYNCVNCVKNIKCRRYQRINTEDLENYETVIGRHYSENIEIEI